MTQTDDIQNASVQASQIIVTALETLVKAHSSTVAANGGAGEPVRLFFPSGVELISLKFKVGTNIDITFQIAGKDAPVKVGASLLLSESGEVGSEIRQ
jgi:hypothetical protein